MGSRPPLPGYNHNVKYRNRVYHVQTEDSGEANPHVNTHLFHGGAIIASARTTYTELLEAADSKQQVKRAMQEQHKHLMKSLIGGRLDPKIMEILGSLDPEATDPPIATALIAVVQEPAADAATPAASSLAPRPDPDQDVEEARASADDQSGQEQEQEQEQASGDDALAMATPDQDEAPAPKGHPGKALSRIMLVKRSVDPRTGKVVEGGPVAREVFSPERLDARAEEVHEARPGDEETRPLDLAQDEAACKPAALEAVKTPVADDTQVVEPVEESPLPCLADGTPADRHAEPWSADTQVVEPVEESPLPGMADGMPVDRPQDAPNEEPDRARRQREVQEAADATSALFTDRQGRGPVHGRGGAFARGRRRHVVRGRGAPGGGAPGTGGAGGGHPGVRRVHHREPGRR